jgi:hypothetical protein
MFLYKGAYLRTKIGCAKTCQPNFSTLCWIVDEEVDNMLANVKNLMDDMDLHLRLVSVGDNQVTWVDLENGVQYGRYTNARAAAPGLRKLFQSAGTDISFKHEPEDFSWPRAATEAA